MVQSALSRSSLGSEPSKPSSRTSSSSAAPAADYGPGRPRPSPGLWTNGASWPTKNARRTRGRARARGWPTCSTNWTGAILDRRPAPRLLPQGRRAGPCDGLFRKETLTDPLEPMPTVPEWLASYGVTPGDASAFDRCEADWYALLDRRKRRTDAFLAGAFAGTCLYACSMLALVALIGWTIYELIPFDGSENYCACSAADRARRARPAEIPQCIKKGTNQS